MLKHSLIRLTNRPIALAMVVFGFLISIAGLFIQYELDHKTEKLKHNANIQILTLSARLEGEISADLMLLRALESNLLVHSHYDHSELISIISHYQKERPSIRHVALAPDLKIDLIHPLYGNEAAMGLDYRKIPAQLVAVEEAIARKEMILTGPINLVQGGTALVARLPVFTGQSQENLWGIITGVFHDQILFERVGLTKGFEGFDIAIRSLGTEGEPGSVFYGSAATFTKEAVTTNIRIPGGQWQIAAVPGVGWQVSIEQELFLWAVALGICGTLAICAYLIVSNYRQKLTAIQKADHQANYDVLTGLSNRYHFSHMLEQTIQDHQRYQQKFALFYLDMDYFKEVNDEWGHHFGDELLCLFAERMKHNVRSDDLIARLGGDEFIIVLKNLISGSETELLAEKLKKDLGEPFPIDGQFLSLTHSLGIAMFPEDGVTMEALLQKADRAMSQAKKEGRNRIAFFNNDLNQEVKRHVQVHNEILNGIREGQFELFFQPIMNLESGKIRKCEALIRWNHPEQGLVTPIHFIPIAEQTGAILALGNWVLEETCHLQRRMKDIGLDIRISLNRSVAEFQPKNIDSLWMDVLNSFGIKPDEIVFEITESLLMDGADSQLDKIHSLRNKGLAFSIDDFGTGYSAINYLRNYPIDYLKIDRSFVQDLLIDEQDRTLVEVIIKMGQTLGIKVIAEGVEEQAQLELLKEFGCDFVQGYLLGRPMPYDQFVELLKKESKT
ncbi:MAG: putative bifunctional diguanylate cyclase/phosphodiesterase [Neptuniibacter sp.]